MKITDLDCTIVCSLHSSHDFVFKIVIKKIYEKKNWINSVKMRNNKCKLILYKIDHYGIDIICNSTYKINWNEILKWKKPSW